MEIFAEGGLPAHGKGPLDSAPGRPDLRTTYVATGHGTARGGRKEGRKDRRGGAYGRTPANGGSVHPPRSRVDGQPTRTKTRSRQRAGRRLSQTVYRVRSGTKTSKKEVERPVERDRRQNEAISEEVERPVERQKAERRPSRRGRKTCEETESREREGDRGRACLVESPAAIVKAQAHGWVSYTSPYD